jgi:hypothetical protein
MYPDLKAAERAKATDTAISPRCWQRRQQRGSNLPATAIAFLLFRPLPPCYRRWQRYSGLPRLRPRASNLKGCPLVAILLTSRISPEEDGQQSGHSATSGRNQIESFGERHEADPEMLQLLQCGEETVSKVGAVTMANE